MKSYVSLGLIMVIGLFSSCQKQVDEKPKVRYEDSSKRKPVAKVDSTQVEITDLPIQMTGTNWLLHPVGDLNIYAGSSRYKAEYNSSSATPSFRISNYGEFEITGYLRNILFQEVGTDSLRPLVDKPVMIQTATFLRSFAEKSKIQIMVYTLSDVDTNKDGKLDSNDIKSLYISEMGGGKFIKISADFEELIDWNMIDSNNRLYFRTIEDTNKNGEFDKTDVVHYHFVDLSAKTWESKAYFPA